MEETNNIWLNDELFITAISNGAENATEVQIISYDVEPAVAKGDNFCSVLFRAKVKYSENKTDIKIASFIIKAPLPKENNLTDFIEEAKFSQNEYRIYTELLPKISDITQTSFSPKLYSCNVRDVLVLDDLKEKGYEMCNRLHQLDYVHCQKVIETLAKFHASTTALHNVNPEIIESNGDEPLYKLNITGNEEMLLSHKLNLHAFASITDKYEEMRPIVALIYKDCNSILDSVVTSMNRRGKVSVLNHGDCWTNNLLFKHEDGKVVDCKFIDFQIRRYGSPAIDLMYFMLTSTNSDMTETQLDQLFDIYISNFNNTLVELGYKEQLSTQELKEELWNLSPWALMIVSCYLPLIVNDPDNGLSYSKPEFPPETLKSTDIHKNPILRAFKSKTYNKLLPTTLKKLSLLNIVKYFRENF